MNILENLNLENYRDIGFVKDKIITLLESIERPGMKGLISYLESSGFFTDPASAKYHGAFDSGLAIHSLAIFDILTENLGVELSDTVIIISLLHDICKIGNYKKEFKNVKQKNTLTGLDEWVKVPGYTYVADDLPIGHGEKSVIMLQKYIKLTDEEICAIRWHMGAYEPKESWQNLEAAQNKYPLTLLLHFADMLASRFIA